MTDNQARRDNAVLRPAIAPQESAPATAEPQYTSMLYNNATHAIASMNSKKKDTDPITGTITIKTANGAEITIEKASDLNFALSLGINPTKLLFKAIREFTAKNDSKKESLDYRVYFPVEDYLLKLGHKVKPQYKIGASPEEVKAEKKRASQVMKDARRKLRADLFSLEAFSVTFTDYVIEKDEKNRQRKEDRDYQSLRLISTQGITNGFVKMTLNPDFADALLGRNTITQYPEALDAIDPRKENAYKIGLAISEHFFIDNNQLQGTANRLTVSTLLSYTNLPTISEVRKDRKSWEERIKEPLENALDELKRVGLLEDVVKEKKQEDGTVQLITIKDAWRYSGKGGAILENAIFLNYESWEKALVCFNLKGNPTNVKRLEEKAEQKEKAQKAKEAGTLKAIKKHAEKETEKKLNQNKK